MDDSWKQSEKKALRSNMARHRAAMIIERFFVSGYVRRVAKASGKAGRKAMVSGPLKRLWENDSAAVFWALGFSGQRSNQEAPFIVHKFLIIGSFEKFFTVDDVT